MPCYALLQNPRTFQNLQTSYLRRPNLLRTPCYRYHRNLFFLFEIFCVKILFLPLNFHSHSHFSIPHYDTLNLKAHVIYNPVKDIRYDNNIQKTIPFLYVGRANDHRKRFSLIKDAFINFPEIQNTLVTCGSENPFFGKHIGIVNDQDLNYLYNTSKFLLFPSSFEGLGLPMIEAMIAGCVPITCSDNKTAIEFCPSEFICDPSPQSYFNKLLELNDNYSKFQQIAIEYGIKYYSLMNKNQIAQNIINLC